MARILKQEAERLLAKVPEDNVFWCQNGQKLGSMYDLEKALLKMADEVYSFHSNEQKTDFSNWVRDVIGDEKLARDLTKSKSKAEAAKSVKSRIEFLSAKL